MNLYLNDQYVKRLKKEAKLQDDSYDKHRLSVGNKKVS